MNEIIELALHVAIGMALYGILFDRKRLSAWIQKVTKRS